MSAAQHLVAAKLEGVSLTLNGGMLQLKSAAELSPDLIEQIKTHKLELIDAVNATNDPELDSPTTQGRTYWDGTEPLHAIHSAATASTEWIAGRDQYIVRL